MQIKNMHPSIHLWGWAHWNSFIVYLNPDRSHWPHVKTIVVIRAETILSLQNSRSPGLHAQRMHTNKSGPRHFQSKTLEINNEMTVEMSAALWQRHGCASTVIALLLSLIEQGWETDGPRALSLSSLSVHTIARQAYCMCLVCLDTVCHEVRVMSWRV